MSAYLYLQLSLIIVISGWLDAQLGNLTLEAFVSERTQSVLAAIATDSEASSDVIADRIGDISVGLSANTLVVLLANMFLITISIFAIIQFSVVLRSYGAIIYKVGWAPFRVGLFWLLFVLYNTNILWAITKDYRLETHFRQYTLDLQAELIASFNSIILRPNGHELSLYSGRFDMSCVNKFCVSNVGQVEALYWVSMSLVILVAIAGVMSGSLTLSPFERDSSHSAAAASRKGGKGGYLKRDLLEYRKRIEDLRTVLYYGSATLAAAVLWMSAHARWAVSPFYRDVPKLPELMSALTLYLVVLYIVILILAFLPPSLWLRGKLRSRYYQELESAGEADIGSFSDWLSSKGLDPAVLTGRDAVAFASPLLPMLLTANLDFGELGKLLAGPS